MFGYLAKIKHAVIRIRTDELDFSALPSTEFDWEKSVHGSAYKLIPEDAPKPRGKFVTLTHYVDLNLMHCILTGRSVTGILTLMNKTPIDCSSKEQVTVETATYGFKFIAARTDVERLTDLRLTLRYLRVSVRETDYMFRDNERVVNSSYLPHTKLHKHHPALSFHCIREAITSKMVQFHHIPGVINP